MSGTRQRLVDAGTRVLAEQGVESASLIEVARRAGQRNRGAVHYHFGSREGLVVAVLEQYADFLAEREGELLRQGQEAEGLPPVVEAVVRPAVEVAETGWRGRCYLVVVAELAESHQGSIDPAVAATLARTGGYEVYQELARRMPDLDDDVRRERLALMTGFVLHSVADRARAVERGNGRAQLGTDAFTANLVAMAAAMLGAPTLDA